MKYKTVSLFTKCLVICFTFQFLNCDKGGNVIEDNDPQYGSISGKIYFKGTAMPISAVSVEIDDKKSISSPVGQYSVDEIIPGTYILTAGKPEYDTFINEVNIVEGLTSLDISMTSKWLTSTLFGSISGEYKGPKSGIEIVILNPDGSESDLKAISGSEGDYKISNVPQGERRLVLKDNDEILFEFEVSLPYRSVEDYQYDIVLPEPFEFVDNRDGKSYKSQEIGNQTWMVENLAFLPDVSPANQGAERDTFYYVYGYEGTNVTEAKASVNYKKYGVLYNWQAARTACPEGWHLPDDSEFEELINYLDSGYWGPMMGEKIKSKTGWHEDGNGNNSSGFNAHPGGIRSYYGNFDGQLKYTVFWSSSGSYSSSKGWSLYYYSNYFRTGSYLASSGYSVRCIRD